MKAAPAASTGDVTRSGASSAGAGSGGGNSGSGTGAGGNGDGAGSGATRAVKIAGDITATRDYPARTRKLRLGKSVIVVLTVGTDGRVHACRIHQASPDPEADAITCRLATERFRFRPATDRTGNPVVSEFGWQQRWFAP
jgi:protein TonB